MRGEREEWSVCVCEREGERERAVGIDKEGRDSWSKADHVWYPRILMYFCTGPSRRLASQCS